MQCLPPKPLDGHLALHGVLIHSRTDCPPNMVYMLKDDIFRYK